MRYVFLPAIFVLVGCADSAPTSTDEHASTLDFVLTGTGPGMRRWADPATG